LLHKEARVTHEEIQAELAQINVRLHAFARGGATRTKDSEQELARLKARKMQLELAWASVPSVPVLTPCEREADAIQGELAAIRYQMDALLSRPRPLTMSGEMEEAERVRGYSDRMQALTGRLAILQTPLQPAPSQTSVAMGPAVLPSAFPTAANASAALSRALVDAAATETDIKTLTSPEAVRDGRFAQHREQVHLQAFGRVLGDGTAEEAARNGTWAGRREGVLAQIEQGHVPAGGFNVVRSRIPTSRPGTLSIPHGHRQTGPMSPQLAAKLLRNGKNLGKLI
jgi:hypothetical protein